MEARVCRILSDKELVLNVGKAQQIQSGQKFEIYEVGEEITDPTTGQSLGKLDIIKGQVTVISVQDKICIAQASTWTYENTTLVDSPYLDAFASPFRPRTKRTEVTVEEKLMMSKTDSDYSKRLVVKVGDLARQVS
jgi:hypothetical protein